MCMYVYVACIAIVGYHGPLNLSILVFSGPTEPYTNHLYTISAVPHYVGHFDYVSYVG